MPVQDVSLPRMLLQPLHHLFGYFRRKLTARANDFRRPLFLFIQSLIDPFESRQGGASGQSEKTEKEGKQKERKMSGQAR